MTSPTDGSPMPIEQAIGLLDRMCNAPLLGFDRREVRLARDSILASLAEGENFRFMYEGLLT